MSISFTKTGASLSNVSGTNRSVSDRAPVQETSTGTGIVSRGSLQGMPGEITQHIVSFVPGSALVLGVVSHELQRIVGNLAQLGAADIFGHCVTRDSILYTHINDLRVNHETGLYLIDYFNNPSNCSGICLDLSSSDCNDISSHLALVVHSSIVKRIRSLGVIACPSAILSPQEVERFSDKTQNMQNVNLQRVWGRVRQEILEDDPALVGLPHDDASAREIRTWMQQGANLVVLQRVTRLNLRGLGLTCVPLEVGLFSGLQTLDLSTNKLKSLPEGLFRGIIRLEALTLANNQLVSLPETLFQGLIQLRFLSLSENQLVSLPETLFQGLSQLSSLFLDNNQLVSLPEALFQGLIQLQILHLHNNIRQVSLPANLLRGLIGLERLNFCNNSLRSLPENLFQGLHQLQTIDLSYNQNLVSLPETLFQGLSRLQRLSLQGNHRLLIFYDRQLLNSGKSPAWFLERIQAFFNYECQSSYARFYQLAARCSSVEALRESFAHLDGTIKNSVLEGCPNTDDPAWGATHAFDDMRIFKTALKRDVIERFENLTAEQKNGVYSHVYRLAQREESVDRHVSNWGEVHAFDNIPRLIDAMMCDARLTQ